MSATPDVTDSPMATPPLMVHVVAVAGGLGELVSRELLRDLTGDPGEPLARGIGLPVRTVHPSSDLRLDAERNLVVALVDDEFLAEGFVSRLSAHAEPSGGFHFVPVALSESAMKTTFASTGPSWVRSFLDVRKGVDPAQRVVLATAHEACKLLAGDASPVRVFVSHAKADSLSEVAVLRAALDDTQMGEFFDARDIPFGDDFGEVIVSSIQDCAVLAVLTDVYPTREWCRIEALEATRGRVPVVVIDALRRGRHRALPYLGGATVVRWREDDPEASASEAMRWLGLEVLRARNFERRAEQLAASGQVGKVARVLPYAPELLTVSGLGLGDASGVVLYPDPPLGTYELDVIGSSLGGLEPRTPTQVLASGAAEVPLKDAVVALSVSEPSEVELAERSLQTFHVTRAFVELARHLLAAGATLGYGGNLVTPAGQERNFLDLLLDLVAAYDLPGRPDRERIRSYQTATAVEGLGVELKAWVNAIATLIPVGTEDQNVTASLSEVRALMTEECHARVVLGGKLTDFAGLLPGIAEESLLALQAGRPLYVLGGFGGAARAVRDLILGDHPAELTLAFQEARTPAVASATSVSVESRAAVAAMYDSLIVTASEAGVPGLNNGLDVDENLRLMTSDDPELCVALVLRGIQTLTN